MADLTPRDAKILAYYAAGDTLRGVARRTAISHEGVRIVLKREGVAIRPRSYRRNVWQ